VRRLTLSLAPLAIANTVLGSLSTAWVFVALGVERHSDAYVASLTLPQIVASVTSGPLTHVLVPLFSVEDDKRAATAWSMLFAVVLTFGAGTAMLILSSPVWIRLVAVGFDADALRLAADLSRVQLLTVVFSGALIVQTAVHHASGRFVLVETSTAIAASVGFAALVVVLPAYGVVAAAWIGVLRIVLQSLILLPGLGRPRLGVGVREALRMVVHRITPLLVSSTYFKLDPLIDRTLGSLLPPGHMSLLFLASQFWTAVNQVLGRVLTNPLMPRLTREAGAWDWSAYWRTYSNGLSRMIAVSSACLAAALGIGYVLLPYSQNAAGISHEDARRLWWLLALLGGYLVAGAAGQTVGSAFYARLETRWPATIGAMGFTVGLALKFPATRVAGVYGIAASTSFYYVLNAVALHWINVRKVRVLLGSARA
jgi:putative peptidoglycan lipid II flippase